MEMMMEMILTTMMGMTRTMKVLLRLYEADSVGDTGMTRAACYTSSQGPEKSVPHHHQFIISNRTTIIIVIITIITTIISVIIAISNGEFPGLKSAGTGFLTKGSFGTVVW